VANSACATILSFFVGWLVLKEVVKLHDLGGFPFYLAPFYIFCTLLGMAALTYAPAVSISAPCERSERRCRRRTLRIAGWLCCFARPSPKPKYDYRSSSSIEDHARDFEALTDDPVLPSSPAWVVDKHRSSPKSIGGGSPATRLRSGSDRAQAPAPEIVNWTTRLTGVVFAAFAGIFSASQYALVNLGSKYARDNAGCQQMQDCPPNLVEAFNNFGSWMVTFGGGALAASLALFVFVAVLNRARGLPVPSFEFQVMMKPGSAAGMLWCLGNFFNTAAVVRGGNAVVFPQILSVQLITCGSWGLLYYQEVQGCRTWLWTVSALFTLAAIILLGFEKE